MYSFSQPTPAEVEACIRRARSERSRVICAFFRRLATALAHRPTPAAPPAKPA